LPPIDGILALAKDLSILELGRSFGFISGHITNSRILRFILMTGRMLFFMEQKDIKFIPCKCETRDNIRRGVYNV
jgi:hypothetical protein